MAFLSPKYVFILRLLGDGSPIPIKPLDGIIYVYMAIFWGLRLKKRFRSNIVQLYL